MCHQVTVLCLCKVDGIGCCAQEFIASFYSFETLPLVEFVLADGITPEEAETVGLVASHICCVLKRFVLMLCS